MDIDIDSLEELSSPSRCTWDKMMIAIRKLYKKKNAQYGDAYKVFGRVSLFQDMKRKWYRLQNFFKEEENSISFDMKNLPLLIPTLVDLANYSIMFAEREAEKLSEEQLGLINLRALQKVLLFVIEGKDAIHKEEIRCDRKEIQNQIQTKNISSNCPGEDRTWRED